MLKTCAHKKDTTRRRQTWRKLKSLYFPQHNHPFIHFFFNSTTKIIEIKGDKFSEAQTQRVICFDFRGKRKGVLIWKITDFWSNL